MPRDKVIRRGSAMGVIKFMRSERRDGERPCRCCPGQPGHIFSRAVKFGPFEGVTEPHPEHLGHGVDALLDLVALNDNSLEGKRVRVTVEVLED